MKTHAEVCAGCVAREAYIRTLARSLDEAVARAEGKVEDLTDKLPTCPDCGDPHTKEEGCLERPWAWR